MGRSSVKSRERTPEVLTFLPAQSGPRSWTGANRNLLGLEDRHAAAELSRRLGFRERSAAS